MAETLELKLRVLQGVNGYYVAECVATAPGHDPWQFPVTAASPVTILRRAAERIEQKAHHPGPGRKPRFYRVARRMVHG